MCVSIETSQIYVPETYLWIAWNNYLPNIPDVLQGSPAARQSWGAFVCSTVRVGVAAWDLSCPGGAKVLGPKSIWLCGAITSAKNSGLRLALLPNYI